MNWLKKTLNTTFNIAETSIDIFRFSNKLYNDMRYLIPNLVIQELEKQVEVKEQAKTVEVEPEDITVIIEEKMVS